MTEEDPLSKRFVLKGGGGRDVGQVQHRLTVVCVSSIEHFVSPLPQHRQTGPTRGSAQHWPSDLLCSFVPLLPSLPTDKHYKKSHPFPPPPRGETNSFDI